MSKNRDRVESPLLRHYLIKLPRVPPYVSRMTSTWVPWVLAILFLLALTPIIDGGVAPLAIATWFAYPWLMRKLYPPRTSEERAEVNFYQSVGRLKSSASDGSYRRRIPGPILEALERCASARVMAFAEMSVEQVPLESPEHHQIERCMQSAILAALPAMRLDQHSRKEWAAICENKALMGKIVDAVQLQEHRITAAASYSMGSAERLEALRELDGLGPSNVVLGHSSD